MSCIQAGCKEYYVGSTVVLQGTFYQCTTGDPKAPNDIKLFIKDPDGIQQEINGGFFNPTLGVYMYTFNVQKAGYWQYRWDSTGGTIWRGVLEKEFLVKETSMTLP